MCSNHTNADMNCTVYKGFIDNKTKLWVWIDLFCVTAYWNPLFFGLVVELRRLKRSVVLIRNFLHSLIQLSRHQHHLLSDLVLDQCFQSWLWTCKWSSDNKAATPFGGDSKSYFRTVILWFVILPGVSSSGSATNASCVWRELSVFGAASPSVSLTFSTSSARKMLKVSINLVQDFLNMKNILFL